MPHPSEETTPSKASLKAWWKQFTAKTAKRESEVKGKGTRGIFGVGLSEGIEYASVPICMAGADGQQYVYGHIPTIVAKCGMFLKEKATTTEGIYRLSGSARRIKELQTIFDSPPSYGKTLTWVGYSVHDAANILRRYLNHLPDPVIPLQWYDQFRSVHVNYTDAQSRVHHYQKLISKLPKENQHLLLYILDLLAVFSSKSGQNLMPAKNLASIFQPGILSHPQHDMAPEQYKLSQEVLEFLIDYQNYFLISLPSGGQDREANTTRDIRYNNGVGASGSRSLKEPHDLNNLPVKHLSLRRSSLSLEHRNKSADSITMIPDGNNEQDTNGDLIRRQDQPDTPSTSLSRNSTIGSLKRSRTLPSKRPKFGGAQGKDDGTQTTTSTIGGSNDNADKQSKRQSLAITLPRDNNRVERKSSQKSRKKSTKKTSRHNKNGNSNNIDNSSSISTRSTKSFSLPSSFSGKKKLYDVISDEKENASIVNSSNSSITKKHKRSDKKGKNELKGKEDNGKEKMTFLLELRRRMRFGGGSSGGSSIGS